jgi:uncharacterized protein YraI
MSVIKNVAATAAALVLSSGVASAAVTESDLNLRAGRSIHSRVIDVIPEGSRVRAYACDGTWCRVNFRGKIGFASQHYLAMGNAEVGPPVYAYGPGYYDYGYPYYDYGYYGPPVSFGFSFGHRGYHGRRFGYHSRRGGGNSSIGGRQRGGGRFAGGDRAIRGGNAHASARVGGTVGFGGGHLGGGHIGGGGHGSGGRHR